METPASERHRPVSADTPDTVISSIFDNSNGSPLSSSISPVSSQDARDFNCVAAPPQKESVLKNDTQNTAPWVNPDYYGTAASQRKPRNRTSQPKYSGFFSGPQYSDSFSSSPKRISKKVQVEAQQEPEPDAQQTTVVLPDASATVVENPEEPAAPAACKRTHQASTSDPATEPPENKVTEEGVTRKSLRPRPAPKTTPTEDVRSSPAPPRKQQKRKPVSTTSEAAEPPLSKKSRPNPTKARTLTKSKPKPKTSAVKGKPKTKPTTQVTDISTPDNEVLPDAHEEGITVAPPKEDKLFVKLRVAWDPSVKDNAATLPTAMEASTSQSSSSSVQDKTTLDSTSHRSTQEQYAQVPATPVPASTQASLAGSSQTAQSASPLRGANLAGSEAQHVLEVHDESPTLQTEFNAPSELSAGDSQATIPTQPCSWLPPPKDRVSVEDSQATIPTQPYSWRPPQDEAIPELSPRDSQATVPTQPCFWRPQQEDAAVTENGGEENAPCSMPGVDSTPPLAPKDSRDISPAASASSRQTPAQMSSDIDSDSTTEDEEECVPVAKKASSSPEQERLYAISEQLFANRKTGTAKPAPAGQPEVWADGRQELCETLHYFRSYQSACYATGGFARGFMFDKVAHARDYMDGDVVISRAGGGLTKDKDSGEMKSSCDQSEDTPIVQALKNCMKHYNPVVVITGMDNPHIPSQPPHQYCVLDYFKPTHIWVEKSGKSKILRYRFEKLNTKKSSWWRPEKEQDVVELGALESPVEQTCDCCGESSLQIYLNGWMCLQPNCTAFWHISRGSRIGSHNLLQEVDESTLIYDPRFLKQKTPWPNDDHDYPLGSSVPELSGLSIAGENTSQAFWSGVVCPNCGRCNSRLAWTGWDCINPNCDFKMEPPHTLISAKSTREPFWSLTGSYTLSRDTHAPTVNVNVSFAHGYRINRYTIPGVDGFITHMIANKTVLEEPGGPDAMFEELQQTDIGLCRPPLPNGQLKGDTYCRHFAVNYGMPYKFIAATASRSFSSAARPVTATRSRLNWAASHLLGNQIPPDQQFNEVLALGYFEAQKINYHDDGEFGLGPTIATLSLGAPATMRLRMKARHFNGSSSAGVYNDTPPLPGSQSYEARAALQPSLDALRRSDPKAYRARLKQIPKELKLRSAGNAKDALKLELGHGDIVVMHGADVQKYYEHAVEHAGKLRFALTCRYIDPESLREADKPGYVVGPDMEGYDGAKLC